MEGRRRIQEQTPQVQAKYLTQEVGRGLYNHTAQPHKFVPLYPTTITSGSNMKHSIQIIAIGSLVAHGRSVYQHLYTRESPFSRVHHQVASLRHSNTVTCTSPRGSKNEGTLPPFHFYPHMCTMGKYFHIQAVNSHPYFAQQISIAQRHFPIMSSKRVELHAPFQATTATSHRRKRSRS